MKKTLIALSALILLASTIITGCGSKSYDGMEYEIVVPQSFAIAEDSKNGNYYGFDGTYFTGATEDRIVTYSETETVDFESPTSEQDRKIIYSSEYSIQTTEFEKAVSTLDALCQKYGAYYERAETNGTEENANRYSSFTVRVPVENYKAFKSEAGTVGVVISSSENNRDVTENYIDTEARLNSAMVREERLIAILENADKLDDVLRLEEELADVRYEIESMSGSLRKLDSLISYSTVDIYIREVIEPVEIKPVPKTFTQKVISSLTDGFEDFSRDIGYLFLDILYNLPGIIIFIIVITIICIIIKKTVKKIIRKIKNNRNTKEQQPDEADKKENS